jgi:dCMP deaminase
MAMSKHELDKAYNDAYFLRLAFAARKGSDDPKAIRVPSSAVGAVLVSENRVISKSANVIPPALKSRNDQFPLQEWERYHFIEHAERAAIFEALAAGETLSGSTLYCTRFPCSDCARAITWFGVARVIAGTGLSGEDRWLESQRAALRILRGSGVKVRVLSVPSPASASTERLDLASS